MKILLISGHGDGDSGAVSGTYTEEMLNIEFASLIKKHLDKYAYVTLYDTTRNAFNDVKNGTFNVSDYDYLLEIHFNAFNKNARGSEIYVSSLEEGITVEQEIMNVMKQYFSLRDNDSVFDGVKVYNYSVIYTAKKQGTSSALLEVCFIDNDEDMLIYNQNKDNIAYDISNAIAIGFNLTNDEVNLKTVEEIAVEVIDGLWSNGEQRKIQLEEAGYDYQTVQNKVNELLEHKNLLTTSEVANEVIDGLWSNGENRKKLLEEAGYDYQIVQDKVNELLK